MDSTKEPVH